MGLPWHNSAIEMFVNLNIKSFGELLRIFVHVFCSRIIISRNLMLSCICNSYFIQSYGLGGEHYCVICYITILSVNIDFIFVVYHV